MSTQIQAAKLEFVGTDPVRPSINDNGWTEPITRFIAHPTDRVFIEDRCGGQWFHEGRGRLRLWPYMMTA